jgi:hypothetical protein
MPENGGILKEKRQLWHFKVRRQKRWHFKGLPLLLLSAFIPHGPLQRRNIQHGPHTKFHS